MTFITLPPEILPGTIIPYGNINAPNGYLLCDGTAISRTSYAALFAVIGTDYGVGDGSTTFNIPDMQGNVPVGIGGSGVINRGDVGGEQTHTLLENEMPSHEHTANSYKSVLNKSYYLPGEAALGTGDTSYTGGGTAHENMQPYVGTEYIIKT